MLGVVYIHPCMHVCMYDGCLSPGVVCIHACMHVCTYDGCLSPGVVYVHACVRVWWLPIVRSCIHSSIHACMHGCLSLGVYYLIDHTFKWTPFEQFTFNDGVLSRVWQIKGRWRLRSKDVCTGWSIFKYLVITYCSFVIMKWLNKYYFHVLFISNNYLARFVDRYRIELKFNVVDRSNSRRLF